MLRLNSDEQSQFSRVGRHEQSFVETLQKLRSAELETMAMASRETFDTLKGRVSMLTDILQQLKA